MGDGTVGGPAPTTYIIAGDTPDEIPHQTSKGYGPTTLPAAVYSYTVTNRSSTSPDHWNVGIASAAEFAYLQNGQAWQAYALNNDVSTISDSSQVPAGSYYLVVQCVNAIEDCQYSYAITVTY